MTLSYGEEGKGMGEGAEQRRACRDGGYGGSDSSEVKNGEIRPHRSLTGLATMSSRYRGRRRSYLQAVGGNGAVARELGGGVTLGSNGAAQCFAFACSDEARRRE